MTSFGKLRKDMRHVAIVLSITVTLCFSLTDNDIGLDVLLEGYQKALNVPPAVNASTQKLVTIDEGLPAVQNTRSQCLLTSGILTKVESSDLLNSLLNRGNIVQNQSAAYVIHMNGSSFAMGEVTLATLTLNKSSSNTQVNLLIKINASSTGINLKVITGDNPIGVTIVLKNTTIIQIAAMSDNSNEMVALLVNTDIIFRAAGHTLKALMFSPKTLVFSYNFTQHHIYNRSLTTKELYSLFTGADMEVQPEGTCLCPSTHPLYTRWPAMGDSWLGVECEQLAPSSGKYLRVPAEMNSPLFITDGDLSTCWMSAPDKPFTKFTVDLGTKYNVILAKIVLQTLPKYLVVSKLSDLDSSEEVLFAHSVNCSERLPIGLPTGPVLSCHTDTKDQLMPISENASLLVLDWSGGIMYNGPVSNRKNESEYRNAVDRGVLLSRKISVYLHGHDTSDAHNHVVYEFQVYASCGCNRRDECSVNVPVTSETHSSTGLSFSAPFRPSFLSTFKFQCNCKGFANGPLCTECSGPYYSNRTGQFCVPCHCGKGAVKDECDSNGTCTCKTTTSISNPNAIDSKCNSHIYSITPTYGPKAGGTGIELHGVWLEGETEVKVGDLSCKIVPERSNGTYAFCKTPASSYMGSSPVYLFNSSSAPQFTYKQNPNVTFIEKLEIFVSGGLSIPVRGADLDSVASPNITVSVVCKSSGQQVASLTELCQVESAELMMCTSPDFKMLLDKVNCGGNVKSKRDTFASSYSKYYFYIGFKFDGYDGFSNISAVAHLTAQGQLSVMDDPSILKFPEANEVRRLESHKQLLEIKGENLRSGATKEDYNVMVGEGKCEIKGLVDNLLTCQLQEAMPKASDSLYKLDPSSKKKLPAVVVHVGFISQHVGYVEQVEDNTIAIAVSVSVVAVILVIAVIALAIILRRRQMQNLSKKKILADKQPARYVRGPQGKELLITTDVMASEIINNLRPWLIPLDHLEISSPLGQGQFGKVFLGSLTMKSGTKKMVAVKTVKADLLTKDSIKSFLNEALTMKEFDHPNVLSLIGVVLNDQQLPMVIIPYMSRGDLKNILKDDTLEFTVGDLIHFALQVAHGMSYLAQKKFIHRDLAARNCMVNDQFLVKVADFGLSHDLYSHDYYKSTDTSKPLPIKWMAIESLTTGRYSIESDIWSFGVLLWELMTRGAAPYAGVDNSEVKEYLNLGQRLPQPEYCPDELYELMVECWNYEPLGRPAFAQICERLNSFISQGCDYERVQTKEIGDDYMLLHDSIEDVPFFERDFDGLQSTTKDYETAIPVENGELSPSTDKLYYYAEEVNSNNSNNSEQNESFYLQPKGSTKLKPKRNLEFENYLFPCTQTKTDFIELY